MMDALQNYDFNAAASGAEFPIGAPGRLIYYYSGSAGGADSTLLVRAGNTGAKFLLRPGQSFKMPAEAKEIDTWYISNYAKTSPIVGVLLIGDGDFKDNRISGSVEVLDGGRSRTLLGQAFIANAGQGATVGQYSHTQILNPAGSGVNAIVKAISFGVDTACAYFIGRYDTALTATSANVKSKKLDGADGKSFVKTQKIAGTTGTQIYSGYIPASQQVQIPLQEPIVLAPGVGLIIAPTAMNVGTTFNAELVEEGI